MLRRAFTAVIERNVTLEGPFETEPYEVAWAEEARWFINVLSAGGGPSVELRAAISPDGLTWCDHETDGLSFSAAGLLSLPLRDFGPWLKLKGRVTGGRVKAIIYLTLKG